MAIGSTALKHRLRRSSLDFIRPQKAKWSLNKAHSSLFEGIVGASVEILYEHAIPPCWQLSPKIRLEAD